MIWCGTEPTVELEWLALHTAPILWFSPDEPLVRDQASLNVPRPLPSHLELHEACPPLRVPNDGQATVYWQIEKINTVHGETASVTESFYGNPPRLPLKGVNTLVLGYLFYYPRDYGLNPHCHDLEGAEFQLDFERQGSLARVVLARVTGLGHGSELMSNTLQIKSRFGVSGEDVRLPVTILVEEGKHASCPDRNGDGHYTPSYDVNVKVADAWGVRDVFGQGVVTSRYQAGFSKPRAPEDRIGPHPDLFAADDPYRPYRPETIPRAGRPSYSYVLERAPRCGSAPVQAADKAFCDALACLDHGEPGPTKPEFSDCLADGKRGKCLNLRRAARRFQDPAINYWPPRYRHGENWWLHWAHSIGPAARLDGPHVGIAASGFLPWGLPWGIGGWFAVRGAALYDSAEWRANLDLSYSPSISRLADWYVAVGYDWGLEQAVPEEGSETERKGLFSLEAGLQIRYRATWLRVGVRTGVVGGEPRSERLVAELGYGPW